MSYIYVSALPLFTLLCSYVYFNMKCIMEHIVWNMLVSETIIRDKINTILTIFNESDNKTNMKSKCLPVVMIVKDGDIIMVLNKDLDKSPLREYDTLFKLNHNGDMIISDNVDDMNKRNERSSVHALSVTLKMGNNEYDITPKCGDPNIFIQGNKIYSHHHVRFICKQMEIEYDDTDIYEIIMIDSDVNVHEFRNSFNDSSHILVEKECLTINNDIKK